MTKGPSLMLVMLFAQRPCCGCCNGDDGYAEVVIRALAMTPDDEWPALEPHLPVAFHRTMYRNAAGVRRAVAAERERTREPGSEPVVNQGHGGTP